MAPPRKPAPAPVEAGQVETEQRDESASAEHAVVPFPDSPKSAPPPPPPPPTSADLSGPEVAEIRVRNDSVDKATKAAEAAREDWVQASRLAQYGQEALTGLVRNLIMQKGLDPALRYRIDVERGRIVPVGPVGPTG